MTAIKPLSADLQKIANEELGEVTSRIPEDLQALKLWIVQQPHLRARLDDQFLIQYLRGCKYSLERAKEKIDRFYTIKTKFPEFCNETDVTGARFLEIFQLSCYIPLPVPLHDHGPRIIAVSFNFTLGQVSIDELLRGFNTLHELLLLDDPHASVCGIAHIIDMSKATTNHFLQVTPSLAKKINTFYEKSIPLRIKNVFYVNPPPTLELFFKLVYQFASEKMKQRIHVCTREDLTKYIPQKYLPKDFGGENGTMCELVQEYSKKFTDYKEYFKDNARLGTDEKLRPGKPIDFESMFGMGGSFRKLDVD